MNKIRVLISDSFDPCFNLATENYIFRDMDPTTRILFLWRNEDTVVIGRFQNPWTECQVQKMEEDGIHLARRQSGGGAVFHDLGNTNFTFLNGKSSHSKDDNSKIICNALLNLDIKAQTSGRNDMIVKSEDGEKKISGSAFKETKDRAFHHGTMLINANMAKLENYLTPNKNKLISKGIKSVRARVSNITEFNPEITHESFCEEMIKAFFEFYNQKCDIEHLKTQDLKKIEKLNSYYEELKDWKWRFGETPKFNYQMDTRFDWGGIEIHIDSHKGFIKKCQIYSDSLHPEMVEEIMSALVGIEYSAYSINAAMDEVKNELPMIADYIDDFSRWFISQIN